MIVLLGAIHVNLLSSMLECVGFLEGSVIKLQCVVNGRRSLQQGKGRTARIPVHAHDIVVHSTLGPTVPGHLILL